MQWPNFTSFFCLLVSHFHFPSFNHLIALMKCFRLSAYSLGLIVIKCLFFHSHRCSKKLENLRKCFGKEHGKEVEYQPKSGASSKEPVKSAWSWYTSLTWLKDHSLFRENTSNLIVEKESVEDEGDARENSLSTVSA